MCTRSQKVDFIGGNRGGVDSIPILRSQFQSNQGRCIGFVVPLICRRTNHRECSFLIPPILGGQGNEFGNASSRNGIILFNVDDQNGLDFDAIIAKLLFDQILKGDILLFKGEGKVVNGFFTFANVGGGGSIFLVEIFGYLISPRGNSGKGIFTTFIRECCSTQSPKSRRDGTGRRNHTGNHISSLVIRSGLFLLWLRCSMSVD
mmetsp:Transcript_31037/g.64760  ORF Transcript_31037/g.64760 Transcript_31037/m.64760 type:complete len:204 (-) Transcript_31037:159-770(-)